MKRCLQRLDRKRALARRRKEARAPIKAVLPIPSPQPATRTTRRALAPQRLVEFDMLAAELSAALRGVR